MLGGWSLVRTPFMFLQLASDLPKIGPTQRAANCATARPPGFSASAGSRVCTARSQADTRSGPQVAFTALALRITINMM